MQALDAADIGSPRSHFGLRNLPQAEGHATTPLPRGFSLDPTHSRVIAAMLPRNLPHSSTLREKSGGGYRGGMGFKAMGVGKDKTAGTGTCPECRFIRSNGLKCHAAAMRGSQFCYFHGRTRICVARPRKKPLQLPPLQDQESIHAALSQVIHALASGDLDGKRAGSLLYALQMAQQTVCDAPPSPPAPGSD
jgi:hypothetical protein